jgi:tmRNA-binding protein
MAEDYKLLATVNARVALSGAKVVQTGLLFVDAVANNKAEALDIIRMSMQDSLAAASQVQFNYERIKTLILEKYSN